MRFKKQMNKRGAALKITAAGLLWLMLIFGIAGGAYYFGGHKKTTGLSITNDVAGNSGAGAGLSGQIPAGGCNVAPTITYSPVDLFNASTPNAGTNRIKVNDASPVTTYATGAGGDLVRYMPTHASYFSAPVEKTLPCGATTIEVQTIDNSTGGHTFNIFNDLGDVINSAGTDGVNLTLGSGGAKNVRLEFTAPSRQAIAPYGAVYCIEGSETVFDSSKTHFGGSPVSKPKRVSLANAANFVNCIQDNTPLQDSSMVQKLIPIAAAAGQNPNGNQLKVHVVPLSWFVDTDGNFKLGTQNGNNVDQAKNDYAYIIDTA